MEKTKIQWCDSTVNPIMGCNGCELYPTSSKEVTSKIDEELKKHGFTVKSHAMFKEIIDDQINRLDTVLDGMKKSVTTTNIWHVKDRFYRRIRQEHGIDAWELAKLALERQIKCYAAILHLNRGVNIMGPEREINSGYAPTFEKVTQFPGRVRKLAARADYLGKFDPDCPWKKRLPRMIFVSDMGDALSRTQDFKFLKDDTLPHFESDEGRRHLWLWLTKRPENMVRFANEIGGFPENVCAMTTVTGPGKEQMRRIDQLREVDAHIRGLSVEPLWDRLDPDKLDLTDIDWLIVGGESGDNKDALHTFDTQWAEELAELCREKNVAYFVKQLGSRPIHNGQRLPLFDEHGGDWTQWPKSLRIREFPQKFHDYRLDQMVESDERRPPPSSDEVLDLDTADQKDFERFDKKVRKYWDSFVECGNALGEIHSRQLWRADKQYSSWESYCRHALGYSKPHTHRLIEAAEVVESLNEALPIGNGEDLPRPANESQARPLARLKTADARADAWQKACALSEGTPTSKVVEAVVNEVLTVDQPTEPRKLPKVERRKDAFDKLRRAVKAEKLDAEVDKLFQELEKLL